MRLLTISKTKVCRSRMMAATQLITMELKNSHQVTVLTQIRQLVVDQLLLSRRKKSSSRMICSRSGRWNRLRSRKSPQRTISKGI